MNILVCIILPRLLENSAMDFGKGTRVEGREPVWQEDAVVARNY